MYRVTALLKSLRAPIALGALAVALAACGAKSPTIGKRESFRTHGNGIYSAAAFQPERIAGSWHQVAAFASGPSAGCAAGAVEFSRLASGQMAIRGRLCLDGRMVSASGPLQMVGPGRFAVPGMADWWVIWVDSGYRTLAIATPSGEFGFVLDRGSLPHDRLEAARQIYDFNGYAAARLQRF